jgi:cysteine desulfurase
MMPYLTEEYGNPASRTHRYGWKAEEAVENARDQIARLINADSNQIIFTSGATESNNMAINNIADCQHFMSAIEHSSVRNVIDDWRTDEIRVTKNGVVDLNYLKDMIDLAHKKHDIDAIFVMMVNNEIGTIQPVKAVKEMAPWKTKVHSDMAQALGKIKIDVQELDVDCASFSSHKIYGPKGVGAIYIKEAEVATPFVCGGGHEFGLRAGTPNVPGIVGFGRACEILMEETDDIKPLSILLKSKLKKLVPNVVIHEFPNAVDHAVHVAVPTKDMDIFMAVLEPNVSVSFGSACMSLHDANSYVLQAVSIPEEEILRSIRIGIGRFNTEEEMELAAQYIAKAAEISNMVEET